MGYSIKELNAIYEDECRQHRKEYEKKVYARLDEIGLGSIVCRKSDGLLGILKFSHLLNEVYPCFYSLESLRENCSNPQSCTEDIEEQFEPFTINGEPV